MKLETAVKKVEEFLRTNACSTKQEITKTTKVKCLELSNVIKRLRKDGKLVEEGEGVEMKLSISTEPEITAAPSAEVEIPVEDEQTTSKPGRSLQKYTFMGEQYGKGPLVLAVVKNYIKEHPKVTLKQLKENIFPDSLMHRFGIVADLKTAEGFGARPRFFLREDQIITLGDKKTKVVVCNQFTFDNLQPFLKHVKAELGLKIGLAK
jgi:hypothetical protein